MKHFKLNENFLTKNVPTGRNLQKNHCPLTRRHYVHYSSHFHKRLFCFTGKTIGITGKKPFSENTRGKQVLNEVKNQLILSFWTHFLSTAKLSVLVRDNFR